MAEFTQITITEMRELLRADKGWQTVDVQGVKEYVMQWRLTEAPHIAVRVYTSIAMGELFNRGVGKDAIRVCAINLKTGFGFVKSRRVHRVKGWRENLKSRCVDTIAKARERLKAEPQNDTVSSVSKFPIFPTKKERREWFRSRLSADRSLAYDALLAIYAAQTDEEKFSQATVEDNGIGFSGVDAELLSSFAEQLLKKRKAYGSNAYLSPKQDKLLLNKIKKYTNQYVSTLSARGVKTLEGETLCQ